MDLAIVTYFAVGVGGVAGFLLRKKFMRWWNTLDKKEKQK